MGIEKVSINLVKVDGFNCYTGSEHWLHAEDRILSAKRKAKSDEDFKKKMITRLKRIKHQEKLYYAVAVLHKHGYEDIANMYTGRIVMEKLMAED